MALEFLCMDYYQGGRTRLDNMLRASPGFHRNFDYITTETGQHGSKLRFIGAARGTAARNESYFRNEPLFYALFNLRQNPEAVDALGIPLMLRFIDDHLAHANTKERARVDQALYDQLARMSIYGEIFLTLRMQRPLHSAGAFSYSSVNEQDLQRRAWRLYKSTPGNPTTHEERQLSEALRTSYATAVPSGKQDLPWLKNMTDARGALSRFWKVARAVRRREVTGIGYTSADIEQDVGIVAANGSTQYQLEIEKTSVQEYVAAAAAAKDPKAAPTVQTVWGGRQVESKFDSPARRTKVKTKQGAGTVEEMAKTLQDATLGSLQIPVKAESLRVFAKTFPSSAEAAFNGLVKWPQFVTAMADAGCTGTHTGGSAVNFKILRTRAAGHGGTIGLPQTPSRARDRSGHAAYHGQAAEKLVWLGGGNIRRA